MSKRFAFVSHALVKLLVSLLFSSWLGRAGRLLYEISHPNIEIDEHLFLQHRLLFFVCTRIKRMHLLVWICPYTLPTQHCRAPSSRHLPAGFHYSLPCCPRDPMYTNMRQRHTSFFQSNKRNASVQNIPSSSFPHCDLPPLNSRDGTVLRQR
jgi:hypothetical protein